MIFCFSVSGRGFRLKMCTTTAAQTTDATTSCPLPSASTARTMFTSLRTATLTPTPGCSTTWPVWSAGTCPTCRGSCWGWAWWVPRVCERALTTAVSYTVPLVLSTLIKQLIRNACDFTACFSSALWRACFRESGGIFVNEQVTMK